MAIALVGTAMALQPLVTRAGVLQPLAQQARRLETDLGSLRRRGKRTSMLGRCIAN